MGAKCLETAPGLKPDENVPFVLIGNRRSSNVGNDNLEEMIDLKLIEGEKLAGAEHNGIKLSKKSVTIVKQAVSLF